MIHWLDANLVSILNGLAIGLLLFVMAVGLSVVFGLMDVLNLAHGSLFLVGSYVAYNFAKGGGLLVALPVALLIGVLAGGGLALATRPLAHRGHLDQALLTLGLALVAAQLVSISFGDDVRSVPPPAGLAGTVSVLGHTYPSYRLMLIVVGAAVAVVIWAVFERTRLGALVRASVADRGMVEALGIDSRKVLYGVFVLGAVLAVVGGLLGAPLLGARPGLDDEVLILALIVVVIGGLGSVPGALVGALLIGQVRSLGVALLPTYASFLLFLVMVLVLVVRPAGLLGDSTRAA